LSWLILKAYLVSRYGVSAFLVFKELAGEEKILFYEFAETVLASLTSYLAIGAAVIFVIKVTTIENYLKRLAVLVPFMLFSFAYLGTGESQMGTRRFILLLMIVGAGVAFLKHSPSLSLFTVFRRSWKVLFLVVLVIALFGMYYQNVRQNLFDQEIADLLLSA